MNSNSPSKGVGKTNIPKKIVIKDSQNTDRDWDYISAYFASHISERDPPEEVDLTKGREYWWTIDKQGSDSSCVGWAVSGVVHWSLVEKGKLDPKRKISARFIWMAAKEIDSFIKQPTAFIEQEGSTLKAALDVCRDYGVVPIDILNGNEFYSGGAKEFYAIAANHKIASYFNLIVKQDPLNLNDADYAHWQKLIWKKWLSEKGPIIIRIQVDQQWESAEKAVLDKHKADPILGQHAASIVGYDSNNFIVRNSWGVAWGDGGYVRVAMDYALLAFDEAYGIVVSDGTVQLPPPTALNCNDWPC